MDGNTASRGDEDRSTSDGKRNGKNKISQHAAELQGWNAIRKGMHKCVICKSWIELCSFVSYLIGIKRKAFNGFSEVLCLAGALLL